MKKSEKMEYAQYIKTLSNEELKKEYQVVYYDSHKYDLRMSICLTFTFLMICSVILFPIGCIFGIWTSIHYMRKDEYSKIKIITKELNQRHIMREKRHPYSKEIRWIE